MTRCKKTVYTSSDPWHPHRCSKPVWKEKPEDGYCKTHHPDNVELRRKVSAQRYREKWENSPEMKLFRALKRIKELEAQLKEKNDR